MPIVPQTGGTLALLWRWLIATVFLLSWPWVAQLSVSVMCEWPAFCLALIAYAVLPKRAEEWSWRRFAWAGGLLAVAVQIKLTALIVGPALAADVALRFWRERKVGRASSLPLGLEGADPQNVADRTGTGAALVSSGNLGGAAARLHPGAGQASSLTREASSGGAVTNDSVPPLTPALSPSDGERGGVRGGDRLEALSYLGVAVLAFAVVFGALILWSPAWNWSQLWGSHVIAGGAKEAAAYAFHPWEWVKDTPGICLGALCGLWFGWKSGRWLGLVFPVVLLGTALAVHLVHRPFWYYYGVHFAVPMALLAAAGVTGLIGIFFGPSREEGQAAHHPGPLPVGLGEGARNLPGRDARPTPTAKQRELALMVGVLCIAIWFGFEGQRFVSQVRGVIYAQKVADNEMIAALREYRGRVKWAYSRSNEPLFYAGFLQPPELTILSKKRFWSGNMTEQGVLDSVKKYDCEVLLLLDGIEMKQEAWKKLTAEGYVNVLSSGGATLYVAQRLDPKPKANNTLELLKKLGL